MAKTANAILLGLLLILMPLAGCLDDSEPTEDAPDSPGDGTDTDTGNNTDNNTGTDDNTDNNTETGNGTGSDDNADNNTGTDNNTDNNTETGNGTGPDDNADNNTGTDNGTGNSSLGAPLSMVVSGGNGDCTDGDARTLLEGRDNGQGDGTADDGVLDDGEVDKRTIVCTRTLLQRHSDFYPESNTSNPGSILQAVIGDILFFDIGTATNHGTGGLWAMNTTNGATWEIFDFVLTSSGGMARVIGNDLFFAAWAGSGTELYVHNTTSNTTQIVVDLVEFYSSYPGAFMHEVVGTTLYFNADSDGYGNELFAYDTVNRTSWLVADINSNGDANPGQYLSAKVGNILLFSAETDDHGIELWAHNAANHTTYLVSDIREGSDGSIPGDTMAHVMGDTLYFDANDGENGRELWAYDTSNSRVWMVANIDDREGTYGSDPGGSMAHSINGILYFDAWDRTSHNGLWAYSSFNGTVWELTVDVDLHYPGSMTSWVGGDLLYFTGSLSPGYGLDGGELWVLDTSDFSMRSLTDINTERYTNSYVGDYGMVQYGDLFVFSASDGTTGSELWAYDNLLGVSYQLADINIGSNNSKPGVYMSILIDDTYYFAANDGTHGYEVWSIQLERTVTVEETA